MIPDDGRNTLVFRLTFISLLVMWGVVFRAFAAEWRYYTYGGDVVALAEYDGFVWAAANGTGVVKFNPATEEKTIIGHAQGLPVSQFQDLAIDSSGNLWLGTEEHGLFLYDHANWTVFDTTNSLLPGNNVRRIIVDHANSIWVACTRSKVATDEYIGGGLAKLTQGGVWAVWDTTNSPLPTKMVHDVAEGPGSRIWIATYSGIASFDGASAWSLYGENEGLGRLNAHSITVGPTGTVWAGLGELIGSEIAEFDGSGNWISHSYPGSYFGMALLAIAEDTSGNVWLGTSTRGLHKYVVATKSWSIYNDTNSTLPHDWVNDILVSRSGSKWVATRGGLTRFDTPSWQTHLMSNSGLAGNSVVAVSFWRDGKVRALAGNRVSEFDREDTWQVVTDLDQSNPSDVAMDCFGNLWVSHFEGVTRISPLQDSQTIGMPSTWVRSVNVDAKGIAWVRTNKGLKKIVGTQVTGVTYPQDTTLLAGDVDAVAVDASDNIWIGEDGTLLKYDGASSWVKYDYTNSAIPERHRYFDEIVITPQGHVWLAMGSSWNNSGDPNTYLANITYFDGTATWQNHEPYNINMLGKRVRAMACDSAGVLWMGSEAGLTRYDGQGWSNFNSANSGLPDNDIRSLSADWNGNLWIGTGGAGMAVRNENAIVVELATPVPIFRQSKAFEADLMVRPFHHGVRFDLALGGLENMEYAWFEIHNGLGRIVHRERLNGFQGARWTATWSGLDDRGNPAAFGVYFAVLSGPTGWHTCRSWVWAP